MDTMATIKQTFFQECEEQLAELETRHKKIAAVKQRLANKVIRVATKTICRIRPLPPRACNAATGAISALSTALFRPAKNTINIEAIE